jgi:hypothetical protein
VEPGESPGRSRHCVRVEAPGSQELARREHPLIGTLDPEEVVIHSTLAQDSTAGAA